MKNSKYEKLPLKKWEFFSALLDSDLSRFLEYIGAPENTKKFKSLDRQEKLFLYYYQLLDARDREDILAFMRVKCHNRQKDK